MTKILQIKALSKCFHAQHQLTYALQDISLEIATQQIYGIIGMSGAGKSTLIRALAGLIPPSSGQILFHNQDIAQMSQAQLQAFRRQIGMIFQHFNLLSSRTVEENICYPLEIAGIAKSAQKERLDELLPLVGLQAKRHSYPAMLSGGEKQRVGIARALANNPTLLLCDEATSALDPKTTKEILKLLQQINQQLAVTIVLITHEMEVIKQICHRVAVLEQGKIVEQGRVEDVFSAPHHPTTRAFLQNSSHEIPPEFFQKLSAQGVLVRLHFKGEVASEPIISQMLHTYNVQANILLGWIDRLPKVSIGTLIIALSGDNNAISASLCYLEQQGVHYEVIENGN